MVKRRKLHKRQQRTVGAFLRINLDNEFHTYCRILEDAGYAFYDIKTREDITDMKIIAMRPILFIIAVYDFAVTRGRWIKIGKLPLEKHLKTQPLQFIQDTLNLKKFEIYDPNSGEIRPATRKECEGLECAAVWEPEHVESRIRDHYAGVPNEWYESLKIKD